MNVPLLDRPDSDSRDIRLKRTLLEGPVWMLLLITAFLFQRPLFFGRTFFFRDLYLHFYPQKLRFVELIKNGGLPLWDRYLHGGQPFLANLNNVALYPLNVLYLVLSPIRAFNIDIVLHVFLAALFLYLLARALEFNKPASLTGALIYAFCGYTLSLLNIWMPVFAYTPLVLLLWHRYCTGGRSIWFGLAVAAGVLQVLAGHPEFVIVGNLLVLAWTAAYPYARKRRVLAMWALYALFVVGICLIQLVPAIELVRESSRSHGVSYFAFSGWSVHPKRLPELVIPRFLGFTDRIYGRDYWGAILEGQFPYILSIYLGFPAVFLCLLGIFRSPDNGPLASGRLRVVLLLIVLVSLALSLGRYLPGFAWLHERARLLQLFRYPVKFLCAAILPISMLSARGLQVYFCAEDGPRHPRAPLRVATWAVVIGLIAVLLAFRFSAHFAAGFQQFFFSRTTDPARHGLLMSFARAAVICLLFVGIMELRRRTAAAWHGWAVAAIVALDLAMNGWGINPYAAQDLLTRQPPAAVEVKKAIGDGRFFRHPDPPGTRYPIPRDEVQYATYWSNVSLNNYQAAFYSIPVIFHEDFDDLASRRSARLAAQVHRVPWQHRARLLSAASVTVVLATTAIDAPGLSLLERFSPPGPSPQFFLYRNTAALAPVSFFSNWAPASSEAQAWEMVNSSDFDPLNRVVVEDRLPAVPSNTFQHTLTVRERSSLKTQVGILTEAPGYLVFADPDYPGWQIRVDGEAARTVRANYGYSAVFLRAGVHEVIRQYRPASVTIGEIGSLVSLLLLLLFVRKT